MVHGFREFCSFVMVVGRLVMVVSGSQVSLLWLLIFRFCGVILPYC